MSFGVGRNRNALQANCFAAAAASGGGSFEQSETSSISSSSEKGRRAIGGFASHARVSRHLPTSNLPTQQQSINAVASHAVLYRPLSESNLAKQQPSINAVGSQVILSRHLSESNLVKKQQSDSDSESTESSCGGVTLDDDSESTGSACAALESRGQLHARPVRVSLSTREGIAIPLHSKLVKKYKKELNATFATLKDTWITAMKDYVDENIDVVTCDFFLGPQLVRYEDSRGEVHTIQLIAGLQSAADATVESNQEGSQELFEKINDTIESILKQREELKSIVGKMWGVNGDSDRSLIFVTDVRNAPDGPRPFVRNGEAAQHLIELGPEKDLKVVRASIDFAINGYESFLKQPKHGLDDDEIKEEVSRALVRVLHVELTLRNWEGFLEEKKKEQQELLTREMQKIEDLERKLQQGVIPESWRVKAQKEVADFKEKQKKYCDTVSRLDAEILKCAEANRLALYTAAAFSSDPFLALEEESSSEESLAERALSQAEVVVNYVQTQVEEKVQASARQSDDETLGIVKWFNKLNNIPSHEEALTKNPIGKSPFAVEVGALLLHTLPVGQEILSYSKFVANHGCEVKKDGIEGSVMQLLLSRDRRSHAEEPLYFSVSSDLKSTMEFLEEQGIVDLEEARRFMTEQKENAVKVPDYESDTDLSEMIAAVMTQIANHTYTSMSASSVAGGHPTAAAAATAAAGGGKARREGDNDDESEGATSATQEEVESEGEGNSDNESISTEEKTQGVFTQSAKWMTNAMSSFVNWGT